MPNSTESDAAGPASLEPPFRTTALLAMASFASSINIRIGDPLLPQIAHAFSTTAGAASIMVTAFAVAYGLLQLAFGPIGDRFGKYRIAALASIATGIATASAALAGSLAQITGARFAAGAMSAAVIPLAFAWIGDAIAFERRQAMLARFLSAQFAGIVLGQAAGGYLGDVLGWRWVFVINGGIHLVAGTAMLVELATNPGAQPASAPGASDFKSYAAGMKRILGRPWVRVMLTTVFLEAFAMYGAFAYIGADFTSRFKLGFGVAGLALSVYGAGALAYSFSARHLLTRLGERGLVLLGGVLLAAGFAMLALAPAMTVALPAMVVLGLGFYMLHNTLQTNATQMAPEARGLGVSLFAAALFSGQSIGVALAAPIVDHYGAPAVYTAAAIALPLVALWFRAKLLTRT